LNTSLLVKRRRSLDSIALLIIAAIGAVLRLALLDQPMRYDEAYTFIVYASQPLGQALVTYSAPNNHLFHTLLVHLTTFGGTYYSEWLIRFTQRYWVLLFLSAHDILLFLEVYFTFSYLLDGLLVE